jgi:hypothetical protein
VSSACTKTSGILTSGFIILAAILYLFA